MEIITQEFWWPQMKHDIEIYVKACHICQTVKPNQQLRNAPLQPNTIPTEPWAVISVDLIGPLIQSKGKDMILVTIDRFSKKAYFLVTLQSQHKGSQHYIKITSSRNMDYQKRSYWIKEHNSFLVL